MDTSLFELITQASIFYHMAKDVRGTFYLTKVLIVATVGKCSRTKIYGDFTYLENSKIYNP